MAKVVLKNVRLSFADIFVPKAFQPGDEPRFSGTSLIPKDDKKQMAAVEAAIQEAAEQKWGKKGASIVNGIRGNSNKFCFQDGDNKDYDGYQGMMALSAHNKARPLVIDRDKTPLTAADGKPYSGCYVNVTLEIFAYTNTGNGIAASLKGIQFVKDGDSFGGGTPASPDDFDDLGVDEDEEDDLS